MFSFRTLGVAVAMATATASQAATPEEQQQLGDISRRGQLIFLFDQAAAVTTDELRAKVPADRMPTSGGGYLVEPRADGAFVVTYFGSVGGDIRPFFIAAAKDGRTIESQVVPASEALSLNPLQQALVRARAVAITAFLATPHGMCASGSPNFVVLPPLASGQAFSVYILSPPPRRDVFPLGGHYRFDIDTTGKVVSERRFMSTCLDVDLKAFPKDAKSVIFNVSHLLDNLPTEIHVFTSIAARVGIAVITPDKRVWAITGPNVQTLEEAAGRAPAPKP